MSSTAPSGPPAPIPPGADPATARPPVPTAAIPVPVNVEVNPSHGVPVRATLAIIGLVMAAPLAVYLVLKPERIITRPVIAALFAVLLAPAVDLLLHPARPRPAPA